MVGSFTLLDVKLEKRIKGSLPIEEAPWQVGVIVGRSGSGKSSIAKELFPEAYIRAFDYHINLSWMIFPLACKLERSLRRLSVLASLLLRIGSKVMIALARGRRCGLTSLVRCVWIGT